jgi:hypothetical protein
MRQAKNFVHDRHVCARQESGESACLANSAGKVARQTVHELQTG